MDLDEEHVCTLLTMGFPDEREIRRALRLAKNDMNEAVAILTNEQPLSSYDPMDVQEMDTNSRISTVAANAPPAYERDQPHGVPVSMEFPTTNLYELQERVFSESWSIPYKKDESLGKCLIAAARLAQEGLSEADENCRRFVDRCLPEAFKKLLTSMVVRRWGTEIQEGIFNMLELLIDFIVARLHHNPVPEQLLLNVLTMTFDPETEWSSKNKMRRWSSSYWGNVLGHGETFAVSPPSSSAKDPYGWLVDLINRFGHKGGFELIQKKFESETLNASTMAALLMPLGVCAELLNSSKICPMFYPCLKKATLHITEIQDSDLKNKAIEGVSKLLQSLRLLCLHLWPAEVSTLNSLQMDIILRMLKTSHFNSRMNALKEITRLIDEALRNSRTGLDSERILDWLVDNKVLSIALEGNIDHVQYADKIRVIIEFLGPRLSLDELNKIWKMQEGQNNQVVDNIYSIMAAASVKFSTTQFEHLFALIQKSWQDENDRMQERLLTLIGKIGRESRPGKISTKVLDLLWDLAHLPSLPTHLLEQALDEHVQILSGPAFKEHVKKNYIIKCIEDIKKGVSVLPAMKQLFNIIKGIAKPGVNKQDKAVLHDLNKTHDIIKLVTASLAKCYKLSVSAASEGKLCMVTIVDGRYTHADYVNTHLSFLKFMLQEGNQYLQWQRCKDIWETLVGSGEACEFDHEVCFSWFHSSLQDLESDTRSQFFQQKLLKLDPAYLTRTSFNCLRAYFQSVNIDDHKMKSVTSSVNSVIVEKFDLVGAEYFWQVALHASDEDIANAAIDNILEFSYLNLASHLKKEPITLHKKFVNECYKRLETAAITVGRSAVSTAMSTATKTLAALAVAELASLPLPTKAAGLQTIRRLLLIAERYASTLEELHTGPRCIPPHGAFFQGHPINMHVACESPKLEFSIQGHGNETLGSVRQKIATKLRQSSENIQIVANDYVMATNKDQKLVSQLGFYDDQPLAVKLVGVTAAVAAVNVDAQDEADAPSVGDSGNAAASVMSSAGGTTVLLLRNYSLDQEKTLPGVVMSSGGQVFEMLYQLAELDDPKITSRVRNLLCLMPTDPAILDALDSLGTCPTTQEQSPKSSPFSSPKKINREKEAREVEKDTLHSLFDASALGMSPFRVLYNLQVLSGKVMPTSSDVGIQQSARVFCKDFLNCGGLNLVINILQKDSLLPETDYDTRQECYFIALQLARYLLCGQMTGGVEPPSDVVGSNANDGAVCTMPNAASHAIKTMCVTDFTDSLACFMRVAWAAAMGKLHLVNSIQLSKDLGGLFGNAATCSRQSSTGSNTSTGSEGEHPNLSGLPGANNNRVSYKDSLIAREALEFLVTCLQLREQLLYSFYNLSSVGDFVIDMLLSSPNPEIRINACEQFERLCQIKHVAKGVATPHHFLLRILLNARVPLWVPSSSTRGTNNRLLGQCTQYFDFRCRLLRGLQVAEQEILSINPCSMLEDELAWLSNFTPSANQLKDTDNTLLAGHLRLVQALLTCEGVDKTKYGMQLIPELINDFLFPASKLISEGSYCSAKKNKLQRFVPKCLKLKSRVSAYNLLVELASGSLQNMQDIVSNLVNLHHRYDIAMAREFEYEPAVEGRAACGYVGLKNAGATCYVNSIIQQLFMLPRLWESVLAVEEEDLKEDSVFFQFQMVLANLLESKLQYYVPTNFLKCFKLRGQPVNVREQQDAFEFFTHLVDQVDESLKKHGRDPVFKQIFEGYFSDQKICQDCPHRYEREDAFMALNLTVKNQSLQDSLDQFVKGELLEGDNAYLCEKCGEKRNTIKLTCIKTLPRVLVIQLKRFDYDWEANRALKFDDHFKFPWFLDMGPYTEDGLKQTDKCSSVDSLHGNSPNLSTLNTSLKPCNYELVGIVVHSGQANAGHYYSFIKERRGTPLTVNNKGKWHKYNDTTVEEFDMTEDNLEKECFGGTYKAKVYESSNLYPEIRQRYWNAYMLFYEKVDDYPKTPHTPKRNMRRSFHRHERDGTPLSTSTPRNDSDGLSQLTALVNHGEKWGLFLDKIPPSIQETIQEDNLRFLQNRDVFCSEYFTFVYNLVLCNQEIVTHPQFVEMSILALELGTHFLLNTYFRINRKDRLTIEKWVKTIETLVGSRKELALWLVEFLARKETLTHVKSLLLECPAIDVRYAMANIIKRSICSLLAFGGNWTSNPCLDTLIVHLLDLLAKEVPDNCRNCSQYFSILKEYSQLGSEACAHLLHHNAFSCLLSFLLGSTTPTAIETNKEALPPKRWSSSHVREFGDLHATMANLILNCDVEPFQTCKMPSTNLPCKPSAKLIHMPESVRYSIFGPGVAVFLREVVTACHEVATPLTSALDMLEQCSFCNLDFSSALLSSLLLQCATVSCNELKNVYELLLRFLLLEDPIQVTRLQYVIDGFTDYNCVHFDGLLAIIKQSHLTDSRRSYQCIKFMVHIANKSAMVKNYLMQTPSKWQWAVHWLTRKMSEHSRGPQATQDSNENSNGKSFQRTISAQDTLAGATALLTELDYSESDMDLDGFELSEVAEHDANNATSPSTSRLELGGDTPRDTAD